MPDIAPFIQASHKLTDIFGCWPDFHDAEIVEVHLSRGDSESFEKRQPTLTAKLHTWQPTGKVDAKGYWERHHHTLVTFRFHNIEEDFCMEGFNRQNVISELRIERQERTDGPSPFFAVRFWACYGMGAIFKCAHIEVVEAVPCTEDGRCMPNTALEPTPTAP
jgi:Immunity protein 50